jgi:hypothetical protein
VEETYILLLGRFVGSLLRVKQLSASSAERSQQALCQVLLMFKKR